MIERFVSLLSLPTVFHFDWDCFTGQQKGKSGRSRGMRAWSRRLRWGPSSQNQTQIRFLCQRPPTHCSSCSLFVRDATCYFVLHRYCNTGRLRGGIDLPVSCVAVLVAVPLSGSLSLCWPTWHFRRRFQRTQHTYSSTRVLLKLCGSRSCKCNQCSRPVLRDQGSANAIHDRIAWAGPCSRGGTAKKRVQQPNLEFLQRSTHETTRYQSQG